MKRFIAGAVCPRCGTEDHVYVEDTGKGPLRGCLDCGFAETLDDGEGVAPAEEAETIRFILPSKHGDKG